MLDKDSVRDVLVSLPAWECGLKYKREDGVKLYGHRGLYSIYPIEYKKGRPKKNEEDVLQLTAQAMCLEEMFSAAIPEGALFYGETRRRQTVALTEDLRQKVREMSAEMHQYFDRNYTPQVKTGKQCQSCSLKEICMPKLRKTVSVEAYMRQMLEDTE